MFCYRDYQLTTRFNQQNEISTSNYEIMNSNEKYVYVYMSKMESTRIINSYHIHVLINM